MEPTFLSNHVLWRRQKKIMTISGKGSIENESTHKKCWPKSLYPRDQFHQIFSLDNLNVCIYIYRRRQAEIQGTNTSRIRPLCWLLSEVPGSLSYSRSQWAVSSPLWSPTVGAEFSFCSSRFFGWSNNQIDTRHINQRKPKWCTLGSPIKIGRFKRQSQNRSLYNTLSYGKSLGMQRGGRPFRRRFRR